MANISKAEFKQAILDKQAAIQHMHDAASLLNERANVLLREMNAFIDSYVEQEAKENA